MPRQVKCRACGKKINITDAFQGSPRMYYCSEQEFNTEKTFFDMVYEFVGHTNNTALFKEMKLWGEHSKVLGFMQDNKVKIEKSMAKNFVSEYAKIRYFSAIIKNSIADYTPSNPEEVKQTTEEIYECKYKHKERRKCLSDYYKELESEDVI